MRVGEERGRRGVGGGTVCKCAALVDALPRVLLRVQRAGLDAARIGEAAPVLERRDSQMPIEYRATLVMDVVVSSLHAAGSLGELAV